MLGNETKILDAAKVGTLEEILCLMTTSIRESTICSFIYFFLTGNDYYCPVCTVCIGPVCIVVQTTTLTTCPNCENNDVNTINFHSDIFIGQLFL